MIFQEFYCTKSGGGCNGYFTVKLNEKINGTVEVVCPNCGHKHQRVVIDGEIREDGRFNKKPTQELRATMGAYSKKSRANWVRSQNERDSVIITRDESFLKERWFEIHGVMQCQ